MAPMIPDGVVNIASIDGFNRIVRSFKDTLILVDFYADWCIPCKTFLPIYQKMSSKYKGKNVLFARMNIDNFPEVAKQFNIEGVPSLIVIRNQKGLKKVVGAMDARELRQLIEKYL